MKLNRIMLNNFPQVASIKPLLHLQSYLQMGCVAGNNCKRREVGYKKTNIKTKQHKVE